MSKEDSTHTPIRRSVRVVTAERVITAHMDWPNQTTARYLFKTYPATFPSVEAARSTVRDIRGAAGSGSRARMANPALVRSPKASLESRDNPYGFPASDEPEWAFKPFPIRKGFGLVLADLHIPYHDVNVLTQIVRWSKRQDPIEFIFIDGDLNDYYELSKFEKSPTKRKYLQEMDATNAVLDILQKQFPKAQIILDDGNHEYRLTRYISRVAPALWGIETLVYDDYLRFKERGILHYAHDDVLTVGRLHIVHGTEVGSSSSAVNPARGMYLRTTECVLSAHNHRTSEHTETTLGGRLITTWSIGCACNLHPEWLRFNKWNHGFATLRVDGNDFEIDNLRVFVKEGMVR
jgi:hypothetical protein